MKINKSRLLVIALLDFLASYTSIMLAFYLRTDTLPLDRMQAVLINSLAIFVTFQFLMLVSKTVRSLWEYASMDEALRILVICANTFFAIYFLMTLTPFALYRGIYAIAGMFFFFFTTMIRFAYRWMRKKRNKAKVDYEKTVVIGDSHTISPVIKYLKEESGSFYPVAVVSKEAALVGKTLHGVKIEGGVADLPRVIKNNNATMILLAMHSFAEEEIRDIIRMAFMAKCKLKKFNTFSFEGNENNRIADINPDDLLGREPVCLDCEEIRKQVQDKVVLVSGGGGSIGSELCRQIMTFSPRQLVILDIYENSLYDLQNEFEAMGQSGKVAAVIGSIRDQDRLDEIFARYRPHIVFHAAAHKHVPLMERHPGEAVKNNVFGTLNIVETADKYQVSRFVLVSSDKAVKPTNIMGATKRISELIIQAYNHQSATEFVAVRFGNVLGSNGSVIPLFLKQIEKGGPLTVTHREVTRFFMTISEAATLVIQAGIMASGGEIFILDMGKPVRIYDLAESLIRMLGLEPHQDIQIEITGLRPGEKLYEELLLDGEASKTPHPKIFVAGSSSVDFEQLKTSLEELRPLRDSHEIKEKIRDIVPEYNYSYSYDNGTK